MVDLHNPQRGMVVYRDFRRGVQTYGDVEDTLKFTEFDNLETDKHGLATKRDSMDKLNSSNDFTMLRALKWYNHNLANDALWLVFGSLSTGPEDRIQAYHPTTFAYSTLLEDWNEDGGDTRIIPFNNEVRFANVGYDSGAQVLDRVPSIYIYNYDTDFFLGEYTGVSAQFNYGNAQLDYDDFAFTHDNITLGDYGDLPNGHYYYKIVGVYDGVQEMVMPDNYGYIYAENEYGSVLKVEGYFTEANFDPRFKSMKIYRGHAKENTSVVYNHIKSIKLNTASGDVGSTQVFSLLYGADEADKCIFVDPFKDFTDTKFDPDEYAPAGAEYVSRGWGAKNYSFEDLAIEFRDLEGEKRYLSLASGGGTSDGILYIDIGSGSLTDMDRLWLDDYQIVLFINDDDAGRLLNPETQDGGDYGSLGDHILYDLAGSWKSHQFSNWVLPVTGGNTVAILDNYTKANSTLTLFRLSGGHGKTKAQSGSIGGTASQDGAEFSDNLDGTVQFTFWDTGYPDLSPHPLEGVEKTEVNYRYATEFAGRLFALDVRLDPGDKAEDHENWLVYSEYNQYDIIPVGNVIPLVDSSGGAGKGVLRVGGSLICVTETGVFRVHVPSVDPGGWEVEHGITDMGSNAPDSIIEAESLLILANNAGVWAINPNDFSRYELTLDIKQDYLDAINGDASNTAITYDPFKRRILCVFGDSKTVTWELDVDELLIRNNTSWKSITPQHDDTAQKYFRANHYAVDADLNVYGFALAYTTNDESPRADGSRTWISQLYGGASADETFGTTLATQWLSTEDMDFNTLWRRLQLTLKQNAPSDDTANITISVYIDKDDASAVKTFTFNANTDLTKTSGNLIVGQHYTITNYVAGDFTNVGAGSNATDIEFVATDLTPTSWGGSTLTISTPKRGVYDGKITEEIYRISKRSTYLKIKIETEASTNTAYELHKMEITKDR